MAETSTNVTEGSGKRQHAWDKVVGGQTVLDQFVLEADQPYASYNANASNISIATLNDHVLEVMAGASLYVKIRKIVISQHSNATTAGLAIVQLFRLSSAGTGGGAVTPVKLDTSDAASGCTAMTLPTAKGTETDLITQRRMWMVSTASNGPVDVWTWEAPDGSKPIIIPPGATNGIAIKTATAVAGATVNVMVYLTESSYI